MWRSKRPLTCAGCTIGGRDHRRERCRIICWTGWETLRERKIQIWGWCCRSGTRTNGRRTAITTVTMIESVALDTLEVGFQSWDAPLRLWRMTSLDNNPCGLGTPFSLRRVGFDHAIFMEISYGFKMQDVTMQSPNKLTDAPNYVNRISEHSNGTPHWHFKLVQTLYNDLSKDQRNARDSLTESFPIWPPLHC